MKRLYCYPITMLIFVLFFAACALCIANYHSSNPSGNTRLCRIGPIIHGFPVHAAFPSQLGANWVKWLLEIEVY